MIYSYSAPENVKVNRDHTSGKQQELSSMLELGEEGGVKLMPNLNDRIGYVVHSTTLDLYTRLGMDIFRL